MRRQLVGYAVFAFAAYLVFLVWTFPAARAFNLADQRGGIIPEEIWVSGLEGSVWSGTAAEALVGGVQLRKAGWSFKPWALLLGRLQASFRAQVETGELHGVASVSRHGLQLKKVGAKLPAALAAKYWADLVKLDGTIVVGLDRFSIRDGLIDAVDGRVVWSSARVMEPQQVRLGDLKLEWSTLEDGVQCVLSDGGGPLQAQGTLRLNPEGDYEFKGSFGSRDNSQPTLAQSLRLMGRPDRDGLVAVSLSGQLPPLKL